MGKRSSQPIRAGQLAGTRVKIVGVYNDALREYVTITNRGTLAQPLGGWVLATLRGERFYTFPDGLILLPSMEVTIYSGQGALDMPAGASRAVRLVWTDEQVWNNRGDVAVLFDAEGIEVDRCAYPHERILGSATRRPLRLLREGETWRILLLGQREKE